ncbi:MAG TPA: DUF1007 family protein [Sediminispirochaeta sp.]|nr:DUF1007 family protein [Sediminispirochaeta sp.]
MKSSLKRVIFTAVLLCAAGAPLFSHPHMFIDTRVRFVFEGQMLEGFWVQWGFDEMFSASIRMDYDANRNGSFESREVESIEENAFRNLRNYNYFISVDRGERRQRIERVESFDAWLEENRLYYRFFVPYEAEVPEQREELRLIIFDDTFFCDIAYFEEEPVLIDAAQGIEANYNIRVNRDRSISYDPLGGRERNGTETENLDYGTAYPYELILNFRRN